jgi:glycosyltransferase involved in cell wall biosynthesis
VSVLESIRKQTYSNIELIVVDNYSVDKTREIAKEFGALIYVKGPERSVQMNFGSKLSQGEYVYMINSDFVLTPGLIEECVGLMKQGHNAIIVWNISDPSRSLWAKTRFYERLSYYGSITYEAPRFLEREAFFKIGGFDEKLFANEDIALGLKLARTGEKAGRTVRNHEIHIGEPKTLKEFFLKNYYYGANIRNYFRKYRNYSYALPMRPSFFRRKFLHRMCKEWPQGLLLLPFLKVLQTTTYLVSVLVNW